jgi:hypothetical protein
VVNGEAVSRVAFRERLGVGRRMIEKQYGKGIFGGEEGKNLLTELEADVLERMIQERLVSQEAKRLDLAVTAAQVRREIEAIVKEVYGSQENFQASLEEEGISPEYLFAHIHSLLLRKEVDKAKLATAMASGTPFGFWLASARQEAKVILYRTAGLYRAAGGGTASCCDTPGTSGAGGCGTAQPSGNEAAPKLRNEAAAAALTAYRKTNPAGRDPQTRVTDFGCHLQVDIEEAGKVVKSYSYQDGAVTEM